MTTRHDTNLPLPPLARLHQTRTPPHSLADGNRLPPTRARLARTCPPPVLLLQMPTHLWVYELRSLEGQIPIPRSRDNQPTTLPPTSHRGVLFSPNPGIPATDPPTTKCEAPPVPLVEGPPDDMPRAKPVAPRPETPRMNGVPVAAKSPKVEPAGTGRPPVGAKLRKRPGCEPVWACGCRKVENARRRGAAPRTGYPACRSAPDPSNGVPHAGQSLDRGIRRGNPSPAVPRSGQSPVRGISAGRIRPRSARAAR